MRTLLLSLSGIQERAGQRGISRFSDFIIFIHFFPPSQSVALLFLPKEETIIKIELRYTAVRAHILTDPFPNNIKFSNLVISWIPVIIK